MRDDPLSPLPDRGLTLLFSFKERSDPLLLSRREEESASCFYIKEKRTHLSPHKEKQGFSSCGKREKGLMPPPQEGPPLFREERGHPCSERRGATLVQRGEGPPLFREERGHLCSERRGATFVRRGEGSPLFREERGHPGSETRGAAPVQRGEGPPLLREKRGHPSFFREERGPFVLSEEGPPSFFFSFRKRNDPPLLFKREE